MDTPTWLDNTISGLTGGAISLGIAWAALKEKLRDIFATKEEIRAMETKADAASRRLDDHGDRLLKVEQADMTADTRLREVVLEPMAKMNQTLETVVTNQTRIATTLEMLVDQEKLRRNGK